MRSWPAPGLPHATCRRTVSSATATWTQLQPSAASSHLVLAYADAGSTPNCTNKITVQRYDGLLGGGGWAPLGTCIGQSAAAQLGLDLRLDAADVPYLFWVNEQGDYNGLVYRYG